jgi:hypothetical protein
MFDAARRVNDDLRARVAVGNAGSKSRPIHVDIADPSTPSNPIPERLEECTDRRLRPRQGTVG